VNAYFISGLGADRKAFEKIKLPDPYIIKHIDWKSPLDYESLRDYCIRMASEIDIASPFVLIGLSFGGIVVTEISKLFNPVKSIIISSVSLSSQLPWYFKAIGRLGLHRLVPTGFLKRQNFLTFFAFGAKTKEEKELLRHILKTVDEKYLSWAIHAILTWRNKERPASIFHIHGTNDRMLPIRYIQPDMKVQNGSHLMVLSKADTINEILKSELAKNAHQ